MPSGMLMMSTIIHPIVFLNLLRTETNTSTSLSLRSVEIITSKVLLVPKNTYLKWVRKVFNSNIGGSSMDGLVGGD